MELTRLSIDKFHSGDYTQERLATSAMNDLAIGLMQDCHSNRELRCHLITLNEDKWMNNC